MTEDYHDEGLDGLELQARLSSERDSVPAPMIHKHYLKKWPAVVTVVLVLWSNRRPVGFVVFALPPKQVETRYRLATWELARLWVSDDMPRNTESWFVSRAVSYVKENHPEVELLISYADPSHKHRGTIYRASNWLQDGRTDQERKTPRFDYEHEGKRYSRRSHVPDGIEAGKVVRVSKFRFVYPLSRRARKHVTMFLEGKTRTDAEVKGTEYKGYRKPRVKGLFD